ncbi:SDR family oxidoreductase [Novosphingobium sp. KCTC 2891]|uniref:glucose 1-dehydrogenase n=1 Tax=Novosphingobium sp. KCTC 2891 TaxID=2989730 RepID=UPI00222241EA|nr:glucose 1-dehydrogenase [Novosphingobium sp. KCTC 2891]MCW1384888.1 SDR family oxidoreductase [Novosphingobium sp. KCTC 2891]
MSAQANNPMGRLLDGRIALVTGGASGIGNGAAVAMAAAGATVILADFDVEKGNAAAEAIVAAGNAATFVACDMRDRASIAELFGTIRSRFGRLDCAFNNVGVGGAFEPLGTYPEDAWDMVMTTNVTSIFLSMKHEIGLMEEQGGGVIVNCGSVCSHVATPNMPAYVASKHAILGLTRSAALDYATKGIRVNAVCPGTIHTPAMDAYLERDPVGGPAYIEAMVAGQPVGRLGTPAEIGNAVVWLCSDASSFVTGHGLVADGGYLTR